MTKSVMFTETNPQGIPTALTTTVVVNYKTAEGCPRCKTDKYVPHYNCLYHGRALGHSAAHCTADACY